MLWTVAYELDQGTVLYTTIHPGVAGRHRCQIQYAIGTMVYVGRGVCRPYIIP